MAASSPCPKCGGRMAEGFLVDEGYGTRAVPQWFAGKAEKSFWTGIKIRGRARHPVVTFRCDRCGFLENYAKG